jgi:WD40 repeat protein
MAATLGPAGEAAWREVQQVIDEEVNRLPERYRVPFVLFHLEGRSSAEVARELGCPVGTVESWLTRARQRLRAGLSRRGLAPVSLALGSLLAHEAWLPRAGAAVQAARATGAVSAEAAALAGEVMRTFGMVKLKVAVALLLLLVAAVGLAVGTAPQAEPPIPPKVPTVLGKAAQPKAQARPAEPVKWKTLQGSKSSVNAVALSADGRLLASGDSDCEVKLWDVSSARQLATLHPTEALAIPLSKGIGWWKQTIPRHHSAHEWPVNTVAFSPDGKTVASGAIGAFEQRKLILGEVKLWEVATGKLNATLRETVHVYWVAFSPDGKALATGGGVALAPAFQRLEDIPKDLKIKERGQVKVWDLATGKARTFFDGETGRLTGGAFSPDGKTLATGGRDGSIRLWDVVTGMERACFREKDLCISSVAFSADGRTLAVAFWPNKNTPELVKEQDRVRLWDVASGRVRARLKGHVGWVRTLAFGPDGTLATGAPVASRDPGKPWAHTGEVRLWDTATGQPRGAPLTSTHLAESVAFDAHSKLLAVGGRSLFDPSGNGTGEITLWNLGGR